MKQKNSFDVVIPTMSELLSDIKLRKYLTEQMRKLFHTVVETNTSEDIVDHASSVMKYIAEGVTQENAAKNCISYLNNSVVLGCLREKLSDRSSLIYSQIKGDILAPTVLDFGCGDGGVSCKVAGAGSKIYCSDIMDYRLECATNFPWQITSSGACEPVFSEIEFDTTLLLTVLHHSSDPISTLKQVKEIGSRRIIIIESVYGISKQEIKESEECELDMVSLEWLAFGKNQQFRYAAFWDWFYNQVVNEGVSVPYNYQTPEQWAGHFEDIGYKEIRRQILGVDQPLVPEFHTLHVFDKAQ